MVWGVVYLRLSSRLCVGWNGDISKPSDPSRRIVRTRCVYSARIRGGRVEVCDFVAGCWCCGFPGLLGIDYWFGRGFGNPCVV